MLAMANAAFVYVPACFAAHKANATEIMSAETIDNLADLDLDQHETSPA